MRNRPWFPDAVARGWPMDAGAVVRSLVGVLLMSAAALQFGSVGAATAAGGAAAVAGAAALQDSPRGPVPMVAAVSLAMGVAVALGGLTSAYPVLFVIAIAAWCAAAGMVWALGVTAGLVATAAGALLVTAPPMPPAAVVVATALSVVAGLAQAALIAVWPRRRWRTQRAALTRAYRSLGVDARTLATNGATRVDPAPLVDLREAFTLPDRQARRRPLEYREWYGLPERIAATMTALSIRLPDGAVRTGLLSAAADALDGMASRSRPDADHGVAEVTAAADAIPGADAALAHRLSTQLREAVALRFGEMTSAAAGLRRVRRDDLITAVRNHVGAMRSQARMTSPIMRHAIRLSMAAAVGTAFARLTGLHHGYWIALTVLMVQRPETAHTYTRCAGRLAGTAAGITVASGITMLWHPTGVTAAALAVLCLGVAYAMSAYGYVAVSAGVAAAVVFLIDISAVAGPATLADRLSATVIGGALAVVGHVLLPDDGLVRLRQRAGELLKAEVDYAATVITAFVHDVNRPADALSAAWQRAFRSRAAFEAACGTTRVEARELRLWLRSYRSALNAVTAACAALESSLPTPPSTALTAEFVTAVDDYVDVLRGGFANPATPWTVDIDALEAAGVRIRETAAALPSDLSANRVLVSEITAITGQLGRMSSAEGVSGPRS